MTVPSLAEFWNENKRRIGSALPQGIDELSRVLEPGAKAFGFEQALQQSCVHWKTPRGEIALAFQVVPDPSDFDRVFELFLAARQTGGALNIALVHQRTDGEGNWDVFVIAPKRILQHVDRIEGSDTVEKKGPILREEVYDLFGCGREFPPPGRSGWAELLGGRWEKVATQLETLADQLGYAQSMEDGVVEWTQDDGTVQAMHVMLTDPADIDAVVRIYERIRDTRCPVTFVFVKCEQPRLFDIFRLSARSYLEHHNQAKGTLQRKYHEVYRGTAGRKELATARWAAHWTSLIGCIKGCLDHLGVQVSDGWVFGATGHAFVMNVFPDLCPSGPTDWDDRGVLRLARNIGGRIETFDEWCPDQERDLSVAQEQAWDFVRNHIDENLPCYGWELDVPEYYLIFGYDEAGYYVSGPGCEAGKGPVPWQELGRSRIGVVLVGAVSPCPPADDDETVREALQYARVRGQSQQRGQKDPTSLESYDIWIQAMEHGNANRFGLAYNSAVWAECRRFAVAFLKEAQSRLPDDLHSSFDSAIRHYEQVARNLTRVSETYPFSAELPPGEAAVDEQSRGATDALKRARDAEAAGLEALSGILGSLRTED